MSPAVEDQPAGAPLQHHGGDEAHRGQRPRTMTSTEEIDNTIFKPGSVKINVEGAFIVDPDTATPALRENGADNGRVSPSHHETSDIRLPNHTAVVSHIAVDVGTGKLLSSDFPFSFSLLCFLYIALGMKIG